MALTVSGHKCQHYSGSGQTSLYSATGKRPGSRVRIISSPGYSQDSLLWKTLQMAKADPDWYVSERGQCASWISQKWLEQQRKAFPAHVFDRIHGGKWTFGHGAYLTREEVARIFSGYRGRVAIWCLGVDLGLARDRAVIAVVGVTEDGMILVDHLITFTPTRDEKVDLMEVEATIREIALRLNAVAAVDPWQAALLCARLRTANIETVEYPFTQQSRMKLYSRLLDVIRNDQLRSHPHELLEAELLGLRVEPRGAGWRVDHGPSGYDDHCVAVGLAISGLTAIQVVDTTEIPEVERQQLRSLERYLGVAPTPPGGWDNLVYDEDLGMFMDDPNYPDRP